MKHNGSKTPLARCWLANNTAEKKSDEIELKVQKRRIEGREGRE